MAKPAVKTEVTTTKAPTPPATLTPSAAPAFLTKYEEHRGRGVSYAAEDRLVPFIRLLQPGSPELKPKNEKFVREAEMGDIYFKNRSPEIIKADEGIIVQPCAYQKSWVEWVPRAKGGGFVARHDKRPSDTEERPNPEDPTKVRLYRKSTGNEVIETRYEYVRYRGAPYVISFTSTGHTVWKEWNEIMINLSGKDASFARLYKLTPKLRTRNEYEWFVYTVEDAGWVTSEDEYLEGAKLEESVRSGLKVADEDVHDEEATESRI